MVYAAGITYWEAFLPSVLLALVAAVVLPWLDRNNTVARSATLGACLFLTARYAFWRLTQTLPPAEASLDFAVGVIFAAVEVFSLVGSSVALVFLTRTKSRTAEADRNVALMAQEGVHPLIDVLICTYNEDRTILERTIIGAQAIEYPNHRVWVCDDGRRTWLRNLCEERGCGYLTRSDNAHAKAGNINNALRHLARLPQPPDFISILDADFVPKRSFLTRAVALTRDSSVGVVQTPQHFFNPDPIQSNLSLARVWPDEQRFFFEVVMPSKDAWGGAFCCGTSSLIRFEPLQRIGGFPTDSVTEDYLVSLRLREIGYTTVYLNETLSVGLAPEGLKEYTTQRSRWALGFVQIFCGPSGPMSTRRGIWLIDRIMLWETFLHWSATHMFRLLGLVVPALYLLFDIQAVYANLADAISHVAPYLIGNMTVMMWMTRGRVLPLMADLSQLLCAQDIVRSVFAGLMRPKGHKFKVTAKGGDRSTRFVQWRLLNVFLFYLALSVAGVIRAFVLDDTRPLADSSAIALFWTWYNIAILTLACFVTIEAPQRRQGDRFASGLPGSIESDGRVLERRVADISVSGARIEGPAPGPLGSGVVLSLDRLRVAATVIRLYPDSFAVTFDTSPAARDAIIEHVYCGDYSAAVATIKPRQVMGAIAARLMN